MLENLKKFRPILNCEMRRWINFTEKLYYNLFFLNFWQDWTFFFKIFSLECCGPRRGPLVCSCSVYTYFKGPHAKIRNDILAFFPLRQQWRDSYTFQQKSRLLARYAQGVEETSVSVATILFLLLDHDPPLISPNLASNFWWWYWMKCWLSYSWISRVILV